MNEYELPNYMKPWKKGGYAKIYRANHQIIKVLPKYQEDCIYFPTILECAITQYLNHSATENPSPFVNCTDIKTNDTHVFIQQIYKGLSLDEWMKQTPMEERLPHIPSMFHQLVYLCECLENHGLQHTDLKPMNILYQNNIVSLIDYNCISLEFLTDNGLTWTSNVGTWKYVAPELIENGEVHSNSIIWSLGMILCYLYDDLPNAKPYYTSVIKADHRTFWKDFYKDLQIKEAVPCAFRYCHQKIPDVWKALLSLMFRWNPSERISLTNLKQDIETLFLVPPRSLRFYPRWVFPCPIQREKTLKQVDIFLNKHAMMYKFNAMIFLWDSFYTFIESIDLKLSLAIAYVLLGLLLNTYIENDDCRLEWFKELHVSESMVREHLWDYGDKIKWKMYQPNMERSYFKHTGKRLNWDAWIQFYSSWNQPYTSKYLMDTWLNQSKNKET